MTDKLTKDQFLARCANAYDAGLIRPGTIRLLGNWLDAVMRFEGGQLKYVADFIEEEDQRTDGFHPGKTLANDVDGYDLIRFSAILGHPCNVCACDPDVWWTRSGFCTHSPEERGR